jgi:hypothetical protein
MKKFLHEFAKKLFPDSQHTIEDGIKKSVSGKKSTDSGAEERKPLPQHITINLL